MNGWVGFSSEIKLASKNPRRRHGLVYYSIWRYTQVLWSTGSPHACRVLTSLCKVAQHPQSCMASQRLPSTKGICLAKAEVSWGEGGHGGGLVLALLTEAWGSGGR